LNKQFTPKNGETDNDWWDLEFATNPGMIIQQDNDNATSFYDPNL
jgi:hypothetical protein